MKVSKRNTARKLSKDELDFLYDEVLVYYENDETDFNIYNQNTDSYIHHLEAEIGFHLETDMNRADEKKMDTFYYIRTKNTKIENFFYHLRNAIAHNRIFTIDNEDTIIFEDLSKKGNLSLYAQVSSFEKLRDIIISIKNKKAKDL